jgi:hypothetical protein
MNVYSGQANVLDFGVFNTAGTPILTGTVNVYLYAKSGLEAGKFYRGSDQSWQAAESVAGEAGVLGTKGVWTLSLPSGVWELGAQYVAWAWESTPSIAVPISIACTMPPSDTLTKLDSALKEMT